MICSSRILPLVGVVYSAPKMDCSYSYLENCAHDLLLFRDIDGIVSVPVSVGELEEQCESQRRSEECVRERSEHCTKGIVKGISRLFLDTIRDEMESRCDFSSAEHEDYLRMAPCLNSISPAIANCTRDFIISTNISVGISTGMSLRQKIPQACCSFGSYSKCVLGTARAACGSETEAFLKNIVEGASGDLIESACASYDVDGEVCRSLLNKTEQLGSESNFNGLFKEMRTFMGAIAKMTDSLISRN